MNLLLTNPAGLWALLGIPAVVAIHFLQRPSQPLTISTLFLLEQTQRESASGRRFERFRNSLPFWLQILSVLLLTWILTEPRFVRANSTQRVALVLDSSASMLVVKEILPKVLAEKIPAIQGKAENVEFLVLETQTDRPRVYQGNDLPSLYKALASWTPSSGTLDPTPTLRVARELINAEGHLIYLTDTPKENLPFGAKLLSIGSPIDNCGFTGITFSKKEGSLIWKALIRNYSSGPQTRTWYFESENGKRTSPKSVTIQSRQLLPLQGAYPEGTSRGYLRLSADKFPLDDVQPLIIPKPKSLKLFPSPSPKFQNFAQKILTGIEHLETSIDAASADLILTTHQPDAPVPSGLNAIILVDEQKKGGKHLSGGIVAEKHPLMDGLNWQPLLIRESTERLPTTESDQVLLWQGKQAVILLRHETQLVFNFDLTHSNALKLPATVVLLHRYCQQLRKQKVALESLILETGQAIDLTAKEDIPLAIVASDLSGETTAKTAPPTEALRAPLDPGFLTISQADEPLLNAATYFADTREADFRTCNTRDTLETLAGSTVNRHTREDPLWRLWILLLVALMLVTWHLLKNKTVSESS